MDNWLGRVVSTGPLRHPIPLRIFMLCTNLSPRSPNPSPIHPSVHSRRPDPILPQLLSLPWHVRPPTLTSMASRSLTSLFLPPSHPSTISSYLPSNESSCWSKRGTGPQSGLRFTLTADSICTLLKESSMSSPSVKLSLGPLPQESPLKPNIPFIPKHEASYTKILDRLFDDRSEIANSPSLVSSQGHTATLPEYALGRLRKQLRERS